MERDRTRERVRLIEAMTEARDQLATLEIEQVRVVERIEALRLELAAFDAESTIVKAPPLPSIDDATGVREPAEQLQIFRGLFRGRPDLYPTRFVTREGKPGYGPACANKFVKGKCELPKVKCGECTNSPSSRYRASARTAIVSCRNRRSGSPRRKTARASRSSGVWRSIRGARRRSGGAMPSARRTR